MYSAWVEVRPNGAIRVRYRRADRTVGSETGFKTKHSAKKRANQIKAGVDLPADLLAPESARRAVLRPAAAVNATVTAREESEDTWLDLIGQPPPRPCEDLSTWIEWWLPRGVKRAEATLARIDSQLRNHILPVFGRYPVDEIEHYQVQMWVNHALATHKPSTVDSNLSLLSAIMKAAVKYSVATRNPCEDVRMGGVGPGEETPIATPLEILHLTNRMNCSDALAVTTAAYTGMRWGEIAGLAWRNVRLDQYYPEIRIPWENGALHEVQGKLFLGHPKTVSSVRRIVIPPFLVTLLTAQREEATGEFVFVTARGAFLRRTSFRKGVWSRAANGDPDHNHPELRRPVVPGMTFHGLRHTHKTWMVADGINPTVQNLRMGHKVPGMAGVYAHATPAMFDGVIEALENRYQEGLADYASTRRPEPNLARVIRMNSPRIPEPESAREDDERSPERGQLAEKGTWNDADHNRGGKYYGRHSDDPRHPLHKPLRPEPYGLTGIAGG